MVHVWSSILMRTSWRNPHLRRGDKRPVYLRVGPGSERVGGWVEKHRKAVRCLLFSRYGKGLMPTIDIWGSIYRTVVVLDLRAGVVRL